MVLFLVPAGRGRFELYAEMPDESEGGLPDSEGRVRRWAHSAALRWRGMVDAARRGAASGRFGRRRDALVCHLADSIAESRTLWALRNAASATVWVPSTFPGDQARPVLMTLLGRARRHHLRWLLVDLVLFIASGLFALIPGPNVLAYYLAFRVLSHIQAWRGSRQGMDRVEWSFEQHPGLAELQLLVNVPREARASRVAAIAAELNLPRLSAFFDRVAVPSG